MWYGAYSHPTHTGASTTWTFGSTVLPLLIERCKRELYKKPAATGRGLALTSQASGGSGLECWRPHSWSRCRSHVIQWDDTQEKSVPGSTARMRKQGACCAVSQVCHWSHAPPCC